MALSVFKDMKKVDDQLIDMLTDLGIDPEPYSYKEYTVDNIGSVWKDWVQHYILDEGSWDADFVGFKNHKDRFEVGVTTRLCEYYIPLTLNPVRIMFFTLFVRDKDRNEDYVLIRYEVQKHGLIKIQRIGGLYESTPLNRGVSLTAMMNGLKKELSKLPGVGK